MIADGARTHLVLMIVKRLHTRFVLDVPQLDKSIRRRRHELHPHRQKVDTQNRVGVTFKRLCAGKSKYKLC